MEKTKEPSTKNNFQPIKYQEIIGSIVGAVAVIYPALNYIYNFFFQLECEIFYGIPRQYFHSVIDNKLMYLAIIFIIPLVCYKLLITKSEESKNHKCETAVFLGFYIGLLNVFNLIEVLRQAHKTFDWIEPFVVFLGENVTAMVIIIIALGMFAFLGPILLEKVRCKKNKWIIAALSFAISLTIIFDLLLMLYGGVIFKLQISMEDKTKYEIVTISEKEYMVLSEHEDKILAVEYKEENDQYIFNTSKYWFYDKYQGTHRYVDLKCSPKIDKEGTQFEEENSSNANKRLKDGSVMDIIKNTTDTKVSNNTDGSLCTLKK